MELKFWRENKDDENLTGLGTDKAGDFFTIHGKFSLSLEESQFNLSFEKRYKSGHSIYYSGSTSKIQSFGQSTSISGTWSYTLNEKTEQAFYLNKFSG